MEEPVFPYKEFRTGQRELAEAVARTVSRGGVLAVRAPTGFGKTAAVIYGHLLAKAGKVLFLVRTVNEVEPVARELRRFGVGYTVLVSPRRTCPLLRGAPGHVPAEDFWENCRIARLRGACPYYMEVESIDPSMASSILSSGSSSLSGLRLIGSKLGACPFFTARRLIKDVDFIIATYPYFFKKELFDYAVAEMGVSYGDLSVVIDEAHSILSIHSITERSLTLEMLERAVEEVKTRVPEYEDVVESLDSLKGVITSLARRRVRGLRLVEKEIVLDALGDYQLILDAAEESRFRAASEALASGDASSVVSVRSPLYSVSLWIETVVLDDSRVFYSGEGRPSLLATLLDPALIARDPLESVHSAVLMSGTLPPHGFLSRIVGLRRDIEYLDLSMASRAERGAVYTAVASDVSTRYVERNRVTYSRIASYINVINTRLPGPKLVVYPSYEVMRSILDKMPAGVEMYVEDRGTSIDSLIESLSPGNRVLINAVAGGKLVEGVEFTVNGRSIVRVVIVVGVPFPQPDDYTREQLQIVSSRLGEDGGRDYVYRYLTMVKVKQALGRARRSPEDRAAFFLLDYRYLRRDLRSMLGLRYDRVFKGVYGLASALLEASRVLSG